MGTEASALTFFYRFALLITTDWEYENKIPITQRTLTDLDASLCEWCWSFSRWRSDGVWVVPCSRSSRSGQPQLGPSWIATPAVTATGANRVALLRLIGSLRSATMAGDGDLRNQLDLGELCAHRRVNTSRRRLLLDDDQLHSISETERDWRTASGSEGKTVISAMSCGIDPLNGFTALRLATRAPADNCCSACFQPRRHRHAHTQSLFYRCISLNKLPHLSGAPLGVLSCPLVSQTVTALRVVKRLT